MNQPEKREEASRRLSQINEVYTNVFRQETTLIVYQKLCQYRKEYPTLLTRNETMLQYAANNLLKMNLVKKNFHSFKSKF